MQKLVELKHGTRLDIQGLKTFSQYATAGSVRGYAEVSAENADAAVARVLEHNREIDESPHAKYRQDLKHKMHWINQDAAMLSLTPQAQINRVRLCLGDEVAFENIKFKIIALPNDNFGLVEVS